MKFVLDVHCHTIASGHAYSTISEIATEASKKGLELIAITDHGPSMEGGPNYFYFGNIKVLPPEIHGVKVLKGIEANIIDFEGNLDLQEEYLKRLDIVLAGLHGICLKPGSKEENTRAAIGALNNPYVDILVHPGTPEYVLDYDRILQEAKKTNTLIEINNSSFVSSRPGSYESCLYIVKKCKELKIPMILGSDTHFATDVGEFDKAMRLIEEADFPQELIINTNVEKLLSYLRKKGKTPLSDVRAD